MKRSGINRERTSQYAKQKQGDIVGRVFSGAVFSPNPAELTTEFTESTETEEEEVLSFKNRSEVDKDCRRQPDTRVKFSFIN